MTVDMRKRIEKVGVVLSKFNVPANLRAEVEMQLDTSVSADPLYSSGQMQEVAERVGAVAFRLDADKKIGISSFGTTAHYHGELTEFELSGYIERSFIPAAKKAGTWMTGTNYAAMISLAVSGGSKIRSFFVGAFGGKKKAYPKLHCFFSDGADNGDRAQFKKLLKEADGQYFILIGVGPKSSFGLMQEAADEFDNVGFVHFQDLTITDDKMYEEILKKEALEWLIAHQPR